MTVDVLADPDNTTMVIYHNLVCVDLVRSKLIVAFANVELGAANAVTGRNVNVVVVLDGRWDNCGSARKRPSPQ